MHIGPDENTPPYGTPSPFLTRSGELLPVTLVLIATRLIEGLVNQVDLGIQEGQVRSVGEPSYRRLDCDRRALAYVRIRPKHGFVRVDVSGLWAVPGPTPLLHPRAMGQVVLLLRQKEDVDEALRYLGQAVRATRRALTPARGGGTFQ